MGTQIYLEQYLDNLESLSPELSRNFKLIYELDTHVHEILKEIDLLKTEYLNNVKSMDNETRLAKMKIIEKKYEKCKDLSDEKVQLANQTYEMVDKHIRRLDSDLTRFEVELKEKSNQRLHGADSAADMNDMASNGSNSNANTSLSSQHNTSAGTDSSKRKKKKTEQAVPIVEEASLMPPISSLALSLAQPADVLDMPVDPNEPTYCLCHQVSYGEMIGCDNSECSIEWFHFGCVGLTTKPKGKWYCPICTEKRKKT